MKLSSQSEFWWDITVLWVVNHEQYDAANQRSINALVLQELSSSSLKLLNEKFGENAEMMKQFTLTTKRQQI